MRACVLNGTKMGCYDLVKGMVVEKTGWSRGDIRCTFSSAVSGSRFHSVDSLETVSASLAHFISFFFFFFLFLHICLVCVSVGLCGTCRSAPGSS